MSHRVASMYLPSTLREFQVDLAGRLVILEEPGREVKSLRERYGFTQEWLANLLDLRRESLSRIESGHVSLSMNFIQQFTRIMTLARGVREHMAYVEARGNRPDENFLSMLGPGLGLDKDTTDEVILMSMINYEKKRKVALRQLGGNDR